MNSRRLYLNLRGLRRLWLLREVYFLVGAYFAYMFVRRVILPGVEAEALENAARVISFESTVGIFWEPHWQKVLIESSRALVLLFNWAYILTFLPVVITTAIIVYFKDRPRYIYYRNVVLLSYITALIIYVVFPLAPPRFLDTYGFTDTIQQFGPTWYASREVDFYYNAYAAMPSLHFGWTLLFGVFFFKSKQIWLKVFGVAYPSMTFFAITLTGNHSIVDALGSGVMITGAFLSYEALRRSKHHMVALRATIGRPRSGIGDSPAVD